MIFRAVSLAYSISLSHAARTSGAMLVWFMIFLLRSWLSVQRALHFARACQSAANAGQETGLHAASSPARPTCRSETLLPLAPDGTAIVQQQPDAFAPAAGQNSVGSTVWARQRFGGRIVAPLLGWASAGTSMTMIRRRFSTAPYQRGRRLESPLLICLAISAASTRLCCEGPFAARSFRRTEAIAFSSREPDRRTALGFVVSSALSIRSALRSTSDLRTARPS
jgi:hypothetical protein